MTDDQIRELVKAEFCKPGSIERGFSAFAEQCVRAALSSIEFISYPEPDTITAATEDEILAGIDLASGLSPEPQADGAKCEDCARPYGDQHGFPDLVVPHPVWEKLMPGRDGAGLLCPSCMCKRGHGLGIESGAVFTSGPFVASEAQQTAVMSPEPQASNAEAALREIIARNQEREWTGDPVDGGVGWVVRDGQYAKISRAALSTLEPQTGERDT